MSIAESSILAAASAAVAAMKQPPDVAEPSALRSEAPAVAELFARSSAAASALMRGDARTYFATSPIAADFTLMSPFGGTPSRGPDYTPERIDSMSAFFRHGHHRQEIVEAYATPDMVVLALIERDQVEVGGLPAQEWVLRVTLVYRRDPEGWRLVHRHADPLAHGVSLEQAAALGRGEAAA